MTLERWQRTALGRSSTLLSRGQAQRVESNLLREGGGEWQWQCVYGAS